MKQSYEIFFAQERSYTVYSEKVAGTGHILSFHQYTAISRKVVAKSARDNHERYCGWFWVRCSSKKFERMAQQAVDVCLLVLEESNKRRFDNYTVRNSVLIVSHITSRACHVHIFAHNLSRNSCILNSVIHLLNNWDQIDNNKSFHRRRHSY